MFKKNIGQVSASIEIPQDIMNQLSYVEGSRMALIVKHFLEDEMPNMHLIHGKSGFLRICMALPDSTERDWDIVDAYLRGYLRAIGFNEAGIRTR
jgi:hypothetical protein